MYIPSHFAFPDRAGQLAFMRRYGFATLVSVDAAGRPEATPLPFLVEERGDTVVLVSHLARNNRQWETLAGKPALVIFAEPHAYVTPFLYEKEQNVPTWNYVAVHAYGTPRLLDHDSAAALDVLDKTVRTYDERYYAERWQQLDPGYVRAMLKGLVAFEIAVETLEAKQKLSQNRSERERAAIIGHFEQSETENERVISEYMKKGEGWQEAGDR